MALLDLQMIVSDNSDYHDTHRKHSTLGSVYVTLYLTIPGSGNSEKIIGYRVFRLFSLTARCSKCDFWNPGQILS